MDIKNIIGNIPIFWINLERAEKRRNKLEELLNKNNFNHNRIIAIDGDNIDIDEYKKEYKINEKMNKYEIGCALSHLKTIKTCYDLDLEYVLILEDDVTFDYFKYKDIKLIELLNELKKKNGECIQLANIINKKHFNIIDKNELLIKTDCSGAQAYLINKEGMKKVLDNFNLFKYLEVSENMIFKKLNNYITTPYFSYPYLRNDLGKKENVSFIRSNTKAAHATQTISKLLWDDYYENIYEK